MLATLQLDPGRTEFISRFVDTYLHLNEAEEQAFQIELDKLETVEQEIIMQTLTSWEQKGLERGQTELVLYQLRRKLGDLSPELEDQVQALSIEQVKSLAGELLDFERLSDLVAWLNN